MTAISFLLLGSGLAGTRRRSRFCRRSRLHSVCRQLVEAAVPGVGERLPAAAALVALQLEVNGGHVLVQVPLLGAAVIAPLALEQLLAQVDGGEVGREVVPVGAGEVAVLALEGLLTKVDCGLVPGQVLLLGRAVVALTAAEGTSGQVDGVDVPLQTRALGVGLLGALRADEPTLGFGPNIIPPKYLKKLIKSAPIFERVMICEIPFRR